MDHLIEVAFKGNRKEFFLWEGDAPPPMRAAVIVDADRGEDLGRIHATGELAEKRVAGVPHAPGAEGTQKRARRLATGEDVQRAEELRGQDEIARRRAMERVKANNLVMKLSDAEWQWDRRKLTIYFTAEKRVDFRNLVRDLAALFRTRIELKQIGVRDEAKRLGGIGRCGREYCSASWLPELRPVNLGVAKDQRLSLNPAQISGACGRLMCCLRYEHEFYVQSRKRFPKEAKVLVTARGEEKVVANDIFNERVTLRNVEGETRVVSLADLKREMSGGPMTVEETGVEEEPDMMLELDEEVIRMTDTAERPAYRPGMRPGMPGFPARPPERPTQLSRRDPAPPRESTAGDRDRGSQPNDKPSTGPRGDRGLRADFTQKLTPNDEVTPPAADAAETTGEMPAREAGGEEPRSPRRRRGRRGGRRGRGRGEGGSVPPNASEASDAPADNGGDNGADDGGDEGDEE
jgi:cell fate regulator YaaT (PSP1 superfamily)